MKSIKLNKYTYCFFIFTILYIFMSAAWANEYGKCFVPLDDPKMHILKPFFLGTEIEKVGVIIEWQTIGEITPELTTNLQLGRRSSIDEDSVRFTGAVSPKTNPVLSSFSGVYQKTQSKYAVNYEINMFPLSGGAYRIWNIKFGEPYDTTSKKNIETIGNVAIDMKCRVDYQFDDKAILRTYYSPDLTDAEKAYLDKDFKNIKDLDKQVVDIGRTNNITNADYYFCAFDMNSSYNPLKDMRYLSWAVYDEGKAGVNSAVRPKTFDSFSFNKSEGIVTIGITKTAPNYQYTLQRVNPQPLKTSKILTEVGNLPIPKEIKELKDFQGSDKELWKIANITDKSKIIAKEHDAICYKWRTILDTVDLQRRPGKTDDTEIVGDFIKHFWSHTEEKKD